MRYFRIVEGMTTMPQSLATIIESVMNIINNILGGWVDLGAPQPLTTMGSDFVSSVAYDAVSLAHFLAHIAVQNPIS